VQTQIKFKYQYRKPSVIKELEDDNELDEYEEIKHVKHVK
jgi:hypothetical protein